MRTLLLLQLAIDAVAFTLPYSAAAARAGQSRACVSLAEGALAGKVALVTGSSSGIGLAIAETLAEAGCDVALHGSRDRSQMEGLETELTEKFGVKSYYIQADMSKGSDCTSMVEQAVEKFGKVDILVNNAGIQHVSPIAEFPEEEFDRVIAINLKATFLATKACLPSMVERGYGRVLNVASVHGKVGSLNKSAYVASKHAVLGFTKVTALETAGTGVTSNTICPGWVLTPLVVKQIEARAEKSGKSYDEESKALVSEKMPSGEAIEPGHFGEIVRFLCSPAAAQITGTDITVDGAWTAQ